MVIFLFVLGVDEFFFMIWGEIEGMFLRLEIEDILVGIGGNGDGFYFKIFVLLIRDVRVYVFFRDVVWSLREKVKFCLFRFFLLFGRGFG